MNKFLFPELLRRDIEIPSVWFQQESATAHIVSGALKCLFEHCVVYRYSGISWPAQFALSVRL
jgi:hypothetical protein